MRWDRGCATDKRLVLVDAFSELQCPCFCPCFCRRSADSLDANLFAHRLALLVRPPKRFRVWLLASATPSPLPKSKLVFEFVDRCRALSQVIVGRRCAVRHG